MGVGVVGSGRGFGMVLHRKNRKFFVPKAFHSSIVQIEVVTSKSGAPGIPSGVPSTAKP